MKIAHCVTLKDRTDKLTSVHFLANFTKMQILEKENIIINFETNNKRNNLR